MSAHAEAIAALHAESGGVLHVALVGPAEGERLIVGAVLGDEYATRILRIVSDCAVRIGKAPRRKPALCLCCPRPIRRLPGLTFAVVLPDAEQPHRALGAAMCRRCSAKPDPLAEAMRGLRAIWPDLRRVDLAPSTGTLQ